METRYCRNCRALQGETAEFCSECGFVLDHVPRINLSQDFISAPEGDILPPINPNAPGDFDVEDPIIVPYGEEAQPQAEQEPSESRIDERIDLLKRQVDYEQELKEIEESLKLIESFEPELVAWEPLAGRSFQKLVTDRMDSEIGDVKSYLERYTEALNKLIYPNPGVMQELRKKFHRTLIASFSAISIVEIILSYLPRIVAHISGHPLLVKFLNYITPSPLSLFLYGFGTFFLTYIVALMRYYRGWSGFQARLNQILWAMSDIANGAGIVRREELRLNSLYPQVKEWLEIIGYSLVRPWKVNPAWYAETAETIAQEDLPYSLRIARAENSSGASMLSLQRAAAEQLLTRGWRSNVLDVQLKVIRESMGLTADRLSVEELDKDISYAPNGPRAIVLKLNNDPTTLEKVAAVQLDLLTEEIQKQVFQWGRPKVREVRSGQVNALSGELADPLDSRVFEWDEFISASITTPGRPTVPFSPGTLTDQGLAKGRHTQVSTFYILPSRLEGNIDSLTSATVRSYDEKINSAMDFVLRVDLTGPLHDADLKLTEESASERAVRDSEIEKEIRCRIEEGQKNQENL
jgi:hypothetical protein